MWMLKLDIAEGQWRSLKREGGGLQGHQNKWLPGHCWAEGCGGPRLQTLQVGGQAGQWESGHSQWPHGRGRPAERHPLQKRPVVEESRSGVKR